MRPLQRIPLLAALALVCLLPSCGDDGTTATSEPAPTSDTSTSTTGALACDSDADSSTTQIACSFTGEPMCPSETGPMSNSDAAEPDQDPDRLIVPVAPSVGRQPDKPVQLRAS